ncbi:hypothetical protein N177_3121 [Lutibaculum baratangense AMV1]|uniref:Uncharacterized protein n=1 Tax=Lutibaculum baratangense AMV1 TaxID=631454 RepID=V4T943_9HYPH|nr:hypothetical protein N177_3121 [Lutibaculum baratangense AMV1]
MAHPGPAGVAGPEVSLITQAFRRRSGRRGALRASHRDNEEPARDAEQETQGSPRGAKEEPAPGSSPGAPRGTPAPIAESARRG